MSGALQRRPLGDTGLTTTALGLGTAALAVPYGAPQGERAAVGAAAAQATIERALERGVRFVDTAPAYGDAETLVGAALAAADAADCLVATKLAIPAGGWQELDATATRDHVRACAEASLRALRRDVLDVLALHNAEPALTAPGSAIVAALAQLRAEGLVRACGASVYGQDAALAAIACEELAVVQVAMNALDRASEARVVPAARRSGTALVARSALLRGVLTPAARELRGPFAPLRDAAERFRAACGATWDELPGAAVAFLLGRPGPACVLLGPRDSAELDALLDDAARFAETTARLDEDWGAGLDAALLDPRRWPALEGVA
jgi:D-threo-aldose 1-dehydrogenase